MSRNHFDTAESHILTIYPVAKGKGGDVTVKNGAFRATGNMGCGGARSHQNANAK